MRARYSWLGLTGLIAITVAGAPAAAQRNDPLPRFEDPLCPGIIGLEVEAAEAMVGRIRARAEEAGLRLADEDGCKPNLLVAFIRDGQGYLKRLSRETPYMFDSLNVSERQKLLAHPGPVHVLSQIRTRSRDGMSVYGRENLVNPPQTEMWSAHSRIYTPTRQDITQSLVLMAPAGIEGMSVGQLADYAVMRALAPAITDRIEAEGNSILNLFDVPADQRPAGMTAKDIAALATLYKGMPNLPASARLAELRSKDGAADEAE